MPNLSILNKYVIYVFAALMGLCATLTLIMGVFLLLSEFLGTGITATFFGLTLFVVWPAFGFLGLHALIGCFRGRVFDAKIKIKLILGVLATLPILLMGILFIPTFSTIEASEVGEDIVYAPFLNMMENFIVNPIGALIILIIPFYLLINAVFIIIKK